MTKTKLIFLFVFTLSLVFSVYCYGGEERKFPPRIEENKDDDKRDDDKDDQDDNKSDDVDDDETKEKREYCDNVIKEKREVTAPKLIEIYERYYQRGSCTEDSDCTGIELPLNCTGNGRGDGCLSPFYQDLVEEHRKETHAMNQKCISDYDFCGSLWPLDVMPACVAYNPKCVENQCVNVFI